MKITIFSENSYSGGLDSFLISVIENWPHPEDDFVFICNASHPGIAVIESSLTRACTIVRHRLPFASLLVASSDDPLCSPAPAAALASDWGSAWCLLGAHGHLNGDSGLRDWDEGRALLKSLA